jgi:hypothetical protein
VVIQKSNSKISAPAAIILGIFSACMLAKEIVAMGAWLAIPLVCAAALAGTMLALSRR